MQEVPLIVPFHTLTEYRNTEGRNQLCRDLLKKGQVGNISIGHNVMKSNAHNGVNRHDAWQQVFVFTKGSGELVLDGERHSISAPCLAVIPAGKEHDVVTGSDEEIEYTYVNVYLD